MNNSKSLIDRVKGRFINLFFLLAAIVAAVLGLGSKAAQAQVLNGFADLVGTAGGSQYIQMDYSDNLMIRDSNGVDSAVLKDGGVWRAGFVKYDGANMNFGGYANNDNGYSDNNPVAPGWCFGRFYSHVFADGDTADDVMIIHDQLGDGIGDVVGGVWTLGADDVVYWTEDIEFNGVQGDINELGPFNYIDTKTLPHMVINPVTPRPAQHPVPANGATDIDLNVELSWTGGYGAVYHNVYFGSDSNSLVNVSFEQSGTTITVEGLEWAERYYWRVDEVDSEKTVRTGGVWRFDTINDCSSSIAGDFNGDCVVDFEDFATFAENWLACTRLGTGACL